MVAAGGGSENEGRLKPFDAAANCLAHNRLIGIVSGDQGVDEHARCSFALPVVLPEAGVGEAQVQGQEA